jgi:hypothetical protein
MWFLWGHKPRQHGKPLVDTLQKTSVFLRMWLWLMFFNNGKQIQ